MHAYPLTCALSAKTDIAPRLSKGSSSSNKQFNSTMQPHANKRACRRQLDDAARNVVIESVSPRLACGSRRVLSVALFVDKTHAA